MEYHEYGVEYRAVPRDPSLTAAQRDELTVAGITGKAATTAAASTTAMDALNSGQLSLSEAAALTEFIVMWTDARVACQTTVVK